MSSPLPAVTRLLIVGTLSTAALLAWLALGAFFLVNSSMGPGLLGIGQGDESPLRASRVQWGPTLHHVALIDVRLRNHEGRRTVSGRAAWTHLSGLDATRIVLLDFEVLDNDDAVGISATRVSAEVDPTARSVAAFRLSRLHAEDYTLNLRWSAPEQGDGEGGVRFNLSDSFRFIAPKPRAGPPKPPPSDPLRTLPWVQIDDIVLADGDLHFEWPTGSFRGAHVTARGRYGTEPWLGLVIDAGITGGRCELTQRGAIVPTSWATVDVVGYTLRGADMALHRLALEGDDADGHDHLRLSNVSAGPERLSGAADLAFHRQQLGPLELWHAETLLEVDLRPGLLGGMAGSFVVSHAAARRVEMDTAEGLLRASNLRWSMLRTDLGGASGQLDLGHLTSDRVELKGAHPFVIDHSNVSGSADVSLTGGSFKGALETLTDGVVSVDGELDVSYLRQRVTLTSKLTLDAVRGGLATLVGLLGASESDPTAAPTAPLSSTATYRSVAGFNDLRRGRWRPTLERVTPRAPKAASPGERAVAAP